MPVSPRVRRRRIGAAIMATAAGLIAFAVFALPDGAPDRCASAQKAFHQVGDQYVPTSVTIAPATGDTATWNQIWAARQANEDAAAGWLHNTEIMMRIIAGSPQCFSPSQVARAETFLAEQSR